MSSIRVSIDEVKNISSRVGQNAVRVSEVRSRVGAVRYNLDYDIRARRNIGPRLDSASNASSALEGRLRELERFLKDSMERYSQADRYLNDMLPRMGLNNHPNDISQTMMTTPDPAVVKLRQALNELRVGGNAVVANAKNVYSAAKKALSPGGVLYKPYQIGKAVVGIGLGVAAVVGSGIGVVFSGGSATPMMVLTAAYGMNQIFNSAFNLGSAITGEYEYIDQVNLLKTVTGGMGAGFGNLLGNEEMGRFIGEGVYHVGSVANIAKGVSDAVSAVKQVANLGKVGIATEIKNFNPMEIKKNLKIVVEAIGVWDAIRSPIEVRDEVVNVIDGYKQANNN